MKKNLNDTELLNIISYSAEPYFTNTTYTGIFDSIEILEDFIEITELTYLDGTDCVELFNLTGIALPKGLQITGSQEFASITVSGLVKINKTHA